MWSDSLLDTIGNTPLVRFQTLGADLPCTLLAKVEFFNPGGSVKDRIAVAMIEDAEAKGLLRPGGTIVEGTSGNTGAGLAIAGIAKGYRCIFTTTDKQSPEKVDVLRALGAEVVVCPTNVAPDDPRSYYSVAERLSNEIPGAFYPNQYDHPANAEAHYRTTGPELWDQTDGRITHFVCGAGTGGTISGTTRFLKEKNPDLKTVGVDPYGSVYHAYFHTGEFKESEIYPYATEGVGEDILAGNMDFEIVDDYVQVDDGTSMRMTRRLAREEGMFVGQSCGMAVAGALDWLDAHRDELTEDDIVVVLLPDSGFRYLSKTYNDEWMRRNGFLQEPAALTLDGVLAARKRLDPVIAVAPTAPLSEAIGVMTEYGISQVPVIEGGAVVGSLSERGVLDRLLSDPDAREHAVRDVMGDPLPVVDRTVPLDRLTATLDGASAVLVADDAPAGAGAPAFHIVTRSDLISALAQAGRG
ncbi:cystathionine beta-synthase [Rubrivirga sp. S365]|uniref:Cystathionine beta-synthase n=1 Tax=Rubrivirga litoralis TaxID=3075598 RepID=A0ABU3BUS1_9BACT|nr:MULTISPECIES: cystathionine beta-synthase [unclassified Rubrivirga]MDT0633022.1 cystathionine beta-synthase [Rubrivirga sp. F394]MDT7856778.1 cystathionine beta-synthase [Rubrivirga sp. S365]